MYVIGKTGTGKSTLLESMALQHLRAGQGFALIDPHGDLVARVRAHVPDHRLGDLIYLDATDSSRPLAFNPLSPVSPALRPVVASGLLDAFKKVWIDSWGPRLEHILRNTLLTLLDQREATLADILRLLDDPAFRRAALANVTNPAVRDFWLREYEQWDRRLRTEAIAPVQNKVGAFVTHPVLQRILLQPRSSFRLREVMDSGRILLVNLAKGQIGEDAAALLGALLVSILGAAGLSRADMPEESRRDFSVYLDEFHTVTTESLAGLLAELRKYRVSLTLAHQYLGQVPERIRDALLANVGTIICFRIGTPDAEILAAEFAPECSAGDLTRLPNHEIYLKMMVDGAVSPAFSAETLTPEELPW